MTQLLRTDPLRCVDRYLRGLPGGRGLAVARTLDPLIATTMLLGAGLRDGRDGERLVGDRWTEVLDAGHARVTVVCDAIEPDPLALGNRALLRTNPHQVVEGLLAAASVVEASGARVVVGPTWRTEMALLEVAIAELAERGVHTDVEIEVVAPDERSRVARRGGELVHDPVTLALVANVLAAGAGWLRRRGTEHAAGTTLVTVLGDVARPVVAEVDLGTSVADVVALADAGFGHPEGIDAAVTGHDGTVLPRRELDVPLADGSDGHGVAPGVGSALVVLGTGSCPVGTVAGIVAAHAARSCRRRCRHPFGDLEATLWTRSRRVQRVTRKVVAEVQRQLAEAGCCPAAEQTAQVLEQLVEGLAPGLSAHERGECAHLLHAPPLLRPDEVLVVAGAATLPLALRSGDRHRAGGRMAVGRPAA